MNARNVILLFGVIAVAMARAEFTPAGARQAFDESSASVQDCACERGDYVFVPANWAVSGNIAKDHKAELAAVRKALTDYLAETTGQKADKVAYDLRDVKSTTVRTFMKKRQRHVVTAYDAVPIRAYREACVSVPFWRRIVFFWQY